MLKFIKEHWKFLIFEIFLLACLIYYHYWSYLQQPSCVTSGFNWLAVVPVIIVLFMLIPMFSILVD